VVWHPGLPESSARLNSTRSIHHHYHHRVVRTTSMPFQMPFHHCTTGTLDDCSWTKLPPCPSSPRSPSSVSATPSPLCSASSSCSCHTSAAVTQAAGTTGPGTPLASSHRPSALDTSPSPSRTCSSSRRTPSPPTRPTPHLSSLLNNSFA
jgi:hypothetical protein